MRNRIRASEAEKPSASTSTHSAPSTSSSPPPRFFFAPRDAYDSTRALLLSLAVTSLGSAGGAVGFLADWLVGASSPSPSLSLAASSGDLPTVLAARLAATGAALELRALPLADARALAAFAVGGAQLAAVSLVVAAASSSKASKAAGGDLSFDFFRDRRRAIATGLVGGLAAAAAVAGVDCFLSSFSSSPATETATATSVAASVLSDASSPLSRAALLSASCVMAPATEELVFRGILLRGLLLGRSGGSGRSSSLVAPVVASAAAFAASHLFVLASDGGGRSGETAKELLLLSTLGLVLGVTAVGSNGGGEEEKREETEGQESKSERGRESDGSDERAKRKESDGGNERAKREASGDSFNLAAPALAHALYNAIAYCVAAAPG